MKTPLIGFPTRYHEAPRVDPTSPWEATACKVHEAMMKGGIIALCGPRGTGKTMMAWSLAGYANAYPDPWFPEKYSDGSPIRARPAIYRTAMMIFIQIRDTYRQKSETSEKELMEWLQDAALLVVDEIQERGESAFEDQKLTAIIDARYQHGRPTLLIGNYAKAEDFAATVSPSILSRMQESGGLIVCDWPSFRTTQP